MNLHEAMKQNQCNMPQQNATYFPCLTYHLQIEILQLMLVNCVGQYNKQLEKQKVSASKAF